VGHENETLSKNRRRTEDTRTDIFQTSSKRSRNYAESIKPINKVTADIFICNLFICLELICFIFLRISGFVKVRKEFPIARLEGDETLDHAHIRISTVIFCLALSISALFCG
jgi:hypothetical protein